MDDGIIGCCVVLCCVVILGGFGIAGYALMVMTKAFRTASSMATRRPYWVVEVDEKGIRNTVKLESRMDQFEAWQRDTQKGIAVDSSWADAAGIPRSIDYGVEMEDEPDPDSRVIGERV
jgi:hypothetical protein